VIFEFQIAEDVTESRLSGVNGIAESKKTLSNVIDTADSKLSGDVIISAKFCARLFVSNLSGECW
jgi:hypothetical protein